MSTSSRSISDKRKRAEGKKPSQTPGKLKCERCQKSELKEFGRTANPYKLRGQAALRYRLYARQADLDNSMKRSYSEEEIR